MADAPRFSLVVATCGRPRELTRLFASLRAQHLQDFEVLIADQCSSDLREEMAELGAKRPGRDGTYLHLDQRGLSRARNAVLSACRGDIIAFPDDDCWYAPDILATVDRRFRKQVGLGLLSGRYGEPDQPHPRFDLRAGRLTVMNAQRRASSITMFITRQALGQQRFDEGLGAGTPLPAGEEMDLLFRLLIGGVRAHYDPSLYLFHAIERASTVPERQAALDAAASVVLSRHARVSLLLTWKLAGRLFRDCLLCRFATRPFEFRNRLRHYVLGWTSA